MPYQGLIAETANINRHEGDQIGAYLARPLGAWPYPGDYAGIVSMCRPEGWLDCLLVLWAFR